jgi:hypothetical protein
MQRAETFAPFLEFLADMAPETDAEVVDLMDRIADTLGDMFGFQSDRHESMARFVQRMQAAADAAALTQTMSRN